MSKRSTTNQFIEKANKIHSNLYDYSVVKYIDAKSKIKIICTKHGIFEQKANNHLNGQGCKLCNPKSIKSTTESFIKKAKEIHKNVYNYSKTSYINAKTKIIIICPIHGEFFQTPNNHLQKRGCNKCRPLKIKKRVIKNPIGWSNNDWKKAAERSKNFDSFKVYIIRCWNDKEEFYKIGKTFTTVYKRFYGKVNLPYNYEIVKTIEGEPKNISKLEKQLQKHNKQFKYIPKINFSGVNECFSKIDKI